MLLATSLLITSCSGENTTNTDNEEPATEIEEDIDNSTTTENENTQSTLAGYTPDTYSSTQESFGGEMTLEVTFTKDAINSIDIIENSDTEGISTHVETVVLMSKVDK